MILRCGCAFIPTFVLDRFAEDDTLSISTRCALADTADHARSWRAQRMSLTPSARHAKLKPRMCLDALRPSILIFDCRGSSTQPGDQIDILDSNEEPAAKRLNFQLKNLIGFYKSFFNRNSIDNNGMGILSSIHFGQNYCNAYWNGQQMIYGDGDGQLFVDFTLSEDVIAHEYAHAIIQYTCGLGYKDEPGALNESIADVLGITYQQWRMRHPAESAGWTIGAGILGPEALARGYRSLRDFSDPGAASCLSRQPRHMRDYDHNGDPHVNSGIPNHAFYRAALAIGGNTWDRIALVWYAALVGGRRQPTLTFVEFAENTVTRAASLFRNTPHVANAIEQAWKDVGIL